MNLHEHQTDESGQPRTLGLGMVFLHEYNHGTFGKRDNYIPTESAFNGKSYFSDNNGFYILNCPDEKLEKIKIYQRELKTTIKRQYQQGNGHAVFFISTSYTNKREKVKNKTNYSLIKSYSH